MKEYVIILAVVSLTLCMSNVQGATLDLQGHRGARGLAPENTLAAFATALRIGVTTLELDLGMTRDGILVVSHDARLNPDIVRTSAGQWLSGTGPALSSLTLSELKRYDVGRIKPGTPYAERFPEQVPHDGSRIPTFAEVVALVERAGNRTVRFNIETKTDPERPENSPSPTVFADTVIAAIRRHGLEGRASIQSFDWRTLVRVQEVAPEVRTVYLTREKKRADTVRKNQPGPSPWTAGLDVDHHGGSVPALVKAAGGRIWSPCFREETSTKPTFGAAGRRMDGQRNKGNGWDDQDER